MLCRLCLIDSTEVLKIFEGDGRRLKIADIIGQHFWFIPKEDDQISNIICCTCWLKVDNFHQFYCFVQEAQNKLENVSPIKQDPTTQNNTNKRSFKKEENVDDDEWMNDTAVAEYVNVISEETSTNDLKNYKVENESKDSDDDDDDFGFDDDSRNDIDDTKDPIEADYENENCDIESKTKATSSNVSSTTATTKRKSSLKSNISKKKRGRPKKKPPNASDSEEDLPLTHFVSQRSKRDKNEQSEWLKKSKEDDEKIAKYMKLKCEICCEEFTTFAQVKQHYRTEHNRKGYVVCCNKKLYKRILLLDHVNKHINPEYFKCDECNKTFSDKQCLKNHMLRHESDESKVFKCDQCPRKYAKQYLLDQHKYIHVPPEERQFICDDCGKAYGSKQLLGIHRNNTHTKAPRKKYVYKHMCEICAKIFQCRAFLNRHQLEEHMGHKFPPVQCHICNALLKNKRSLREHLAGHEDHGQIHRCDICGKQGPTRRSIADHKRFVHNDRRFICTVCNKGFKRPIVLKEHMTTHTGEILYRCTFCPKVFNSNANMHSHKKKNHPIEWEQEKQKKLKINQQELLH